MISNVTDKNEIIKLYTVHKMTQKSIAEKLGVSISRINQILKSNNIDKNSRKIGPYYELKVKKLYLEDKLSQKDISRVLKISQSTVSGILKSIYLKERERM